MKTTITPEEMETTPKNTSISVLDMVTWWTQSNDGSFNWDLYKKLIDAKRCNHYFEI
jgi:hypothetical protein